MVELVRLKRVPLTKIFKKQEKDFIPWLVQVNTLQILGEAVGMDLRVEILNGNNNKNLPDIICKDLNSTKVDEGVLIEAQFGESYNNHLLRFLNNISILSSSSVIWIAEHFTDEHKAVLDWLNKIGTGRVRLFALEIELLKMGHNTEVAANFKIISRPVNMQINKVQAKSEIIPTRIREGKRTIKKSGYGGVKGRRAGVIDEDKLTPSQAFWLKYWRGFDKYQKSVNAMVQVPNLLPKPFIAYSIGKTGIILKTIPLVFKKSLSIDLNFWKKETAPFYYILQLEKEEIEKELGLPLLWDDMEGKQGCKIRLIIENKDYRNESDWNSQFEWFSKNMDGLVRVIKPRLKVINPEEWINNT